jgi:hypothetical protein
MSALLPSHHHGRPCARRIAIAVIRMALWLALIGCGSGTVAARERQAGLSPYDIFSDAAPRPLRAVPTKNEGAKIDRPVTTTSAKPPPTKLPAAGLRGQVHPAALIFPPVAPLE